MFQEDGDLDFRADCHFSRKQSVELNVFCAECVRISVCFFFREILTKNIYEDTIKTLIRCWFDRQSLLNKSIKTLPDSMVSIYDLFIQISMFLSYIHSCDFFSHVLA